MCSGAHGSKVGAGIVEEGETIVMAGGEHGVLHAGLFGESCPGVGIELVGIELAGQLGVLVDGNLLGPLDPLTAGGNGIDAPVHEEAELGVAPPGDARGGILVGDEGRPLRAERCGTSEYNQQKGDESCLRTAHDRFLFHKFASGWLRWRR